MNPLDLLILALAVSRLSRLIVSDSITEKLRNWIWYRLPASDTEFGDSEVKVDGKDTLGNQIGVLHKTGVHVFRTRTAWYATQPRMIGNLISCPWCAGFWVAIAVWAGYWFYPETVIFTVPFALSEITGLLNARS